MEGKDNRSKDKRHKMKHMKQQYHRQAGNTSSSSALDASVSGIVDIVDSSDERFVTKGGGWKSSIKPQSKPRDMLTDDTDLDDLENVEHAQLRAGDFKQMSQLPTSIGGHFKFSSEKQWDTTMEGDSELLENTEASEYFTLNLKLLNAGLKTIPFYKRMEYPSSMFSKEQLATMNKSAENAELVYQNVLKDHLNNPNPKIKINSATGSTKSNAGSAAAANGNSNSAAAANGNVAQTATAAAAATVPDELDELLSMTSDQVSKVSLRSVANASVVARSAAPSRAASVQENKNDIQEWLDNVLEE